MASESSQEDAEILIVQAAIAVEIARLAPGPEPAEQAKRIAGHLARIGLTYRSSKSETAARAERTATAINRVPVDGELGGQPRP